MKVKIILRKLWEFRLLVNIWDLFFNQLLFLLSIEKLDQDFIFKFFLFLYKKKLSSNRFWNLENFLKSKENSLNKIKIKWG